MKYNLTPLAGMAEFTPAQQLIFENWKQTVANTYRLFGFTPIETPVLERTAILLAKAGGETEKQIYRFKKGDSDLAMRFDLTVPLARYVALHQSDLQFPFRRLAIGKVYRGERAQTGRYREFYQADADIIGRGKLDLSYDSEIISLMATTIGRLNLGEFTIFINNRKLVMGFLQALKIMDSDKVLHLLDGSEKMSESALKKELSLLRLDTFEIRKLLSFAKLQGSFDHFIGELENLEVSGALFRAGIDELSQVETGLKALGVDPNCYRYHAGIIRGLDYYTGTVFETKLNQATQLGSICSGGRYENLVGGFASEKMPGVGTSIGLTRLFSQVLHLGIINPEQKTCSQIVVLPFTGDISSTLAITKQLRSAQIPSEVYLQNASIKKKMKYAGDLGVKFALIVGDDELASGELTLKNMHTGEQLKLNLPSIIDYIHGQNQS